MRTPIRSTLIPLLATAILGACAVHEPYQRPKSVLPEAWIGGRAVSVSEPASATVKWWQGFEDPALAALLDAVLANNQDLRAAGHRIAQARAAATVAGAARYPAISGGAGLGRSRPFSDGGAVNQFTLDGSVGFEPDLWDKFVNLSRSAEAAVDAAGEAAQVVRLTLTADAANAYFEHAAFVQRLELARRSVSVAERIDGIVAVRQRNGAASGLDRAQSMTSLASIRATVPPLEQAVAQTRHTMSLLAGLAPGDTTIAPPSLTDIRLPQRVPVGLPADILLRRPDIRLAEANLRAAHADIGVARANLYPSLQLTSDIGFAAPQLTNLLQGSNGLLSIGANLLTPIFQAGRLRAISEATRERHAELVQTYQRTILGSLRDVESTLVAMEKTEAQETALQQVVGHAAEAFRLAEIRYAAGSLDALTLLTTQNSLLNAQNGVLQARLSRIAAIVGLYRALGGGW